MSIYCGTINKMSEVSGATSDIEWFATPWCHFLANYMIITRWLDAINLFWIYFKTHLFWFSTRWSHLAVVVMYLVWESNWWPKYIHPRSHAIIVLNHDTDSSLVYGHWWHDLNFIPLQEWMWLHCVIMQGALSACGRKMHVRVKKMQLNCWCPRISYDVTSILWVE